MNAYIERVIETVKKKHGNEPEFVQTVDGESFDLEVGKREYKRYEVGDTYTFKEYTGAFGKPFYARD